MIKERFLKKTERFRKDFGKIGFWAVLAMVLPIIGQTVFLGLIYRVSPWLAETALTLTHEGFANTEARDRHGEGWGSCLENFAAQFEGEHA